MNEVEWKEWLSQYSKQVLEQVGVGPGRVVLDFGCGSGTYALPAARLVGAGGRVYALDRDLNALETLRRAAREEGLRNIETILSSDLDTGLEDGIAEIVLLHDVLHMIPERMALLRTVRNVLCPGGRVSVHPMHVDTDEVSRQMHDSEFSLQAEEYEGHILVYEKQAPVEGASGEVG